MKAKTKMGSADQELNAIGTILDALDGLEGESIQRVLDYVFGRLSISRSSRTSTAPSAPAVANSTSIGELRHLSMQPSIRDLKEEKLPRSANQMAALVAYYLSEVAPENDRKDSINASDVEKYFKQAGFKLPKVISQVLPNAAAAGYFESTGGGLYQLNPVGYNLVVHGLPRGGEDRAPLRKPAKKKRSTGRR